MTQKRTGDISVRNKQDMNDPYAQYAVKDNQASEDPYAQYAQKQEAPQENNEESKGLYGVGKDVLNKVIGATKNIYNQASHPLDTLQNSITQMHGAGMQMGMDPYRAYGNIGAGVGQPVINALNKPGELRDYLVKKELASKESPSFRFMPKDVNVAQEMGIEGRQLGDEFIRGIPEALALGKSGELMSGLKGYRSPHLHAQKLQEVLGDIENTKAEHSQYLNPGAAHSARASQEFLNVIEGTENPQTGKREGGLRKEVGSQYDRLKEDLRHDKVTLEMSPDMKQVQSFVSKLGKGVEEEEAANLYKILSEDKKTITAADALDAYRELKHQKGKALMQARKGGSGIGPQARKEFVMEAKEIGKNEEKLRSALDKLNPEYLRRLKMIDTQFAKHIAPLYENNMYQEMKKHGHTSKNMMEYLHGTTPGNATLNKIVEKNPNLQKLIIGQQYASKPMNLANPSEILDSYSGSNPNIARMIREQQEIKHTNENVIPELKEAITKAREKKIGRKGFIKGALTAAGGAAAGIATETALGRDWKKDLPLFAALLSIKKSRTK